MTTTHHQAHAFGCSACEGVLRGFVKGRELKLCRRSVNTYAVKSMEGGWVVDSLNGDGVLGCSNPVDLKNKVED